MIKFLRIPFFSIFSESVLKYVVLIYKQREYIDLCTSYKHLNLTNLFISCFCFSAFSGSSANFRMFLLQFSTGFVLTHVTFLERISTKGEMIVISFFNLMEWTTCLVFWKCTQFSPSIHQLYYLYAFFEIWWLFVNTNLYNPFQSFLNFILSFFVKFCFIFIYLNF